MSRYRMSLDSGWESNAFEPLKEVEFKTADKKTIVYSKIVHGEWKGKPIAGNCTVRCSVCGSAFLDNDGRWNYCPNCGADMKGGNNELHKRL